MLNIQQNIPLKNRTTFHIGGPAKFFVEVKSEEELIEAISYAKENSLEFFILGGGSNLLVSDKGFDGIIIKLKNQNSKLKFTTQKSKLSYIDSWAGTSLALLVSESANNSLTGMEWAAGIPGTVGGAVRGNAGAFGGSISDIVENIKVLEISDIKEVRPPRLPKLGTSGQVSTSMTKTCLPARQGGRTSSEFQITNYKLRDCKFAYRSSIFKENPNLIILSAKLKLKTGDKAEIENKIKEVISERSANQPQGATAGSFFMNPVVTNEKLRQEFEKDAGKIIKDDKLPAGWLIQHLDLGGKKIGGAMVSKDHGNWIINTGDATAEDVIILVSIIKQKVRNKFRINLREEIRYLGF